MRKKRERKVKKRRDKYILQLLITSGKPQEKNEEKYTNLTKFFFKNVKGGDPLANLPDAKTSTRRFEP